jgi:serine/threonine protein kinase
VKVADFGIARVSDSKLTQEGVMVGTPQYMSPEQFSGMKVDGRSDLFSAAVIVYEMLTGEHPFPAHGVSAIMHQVIKIDPVPPKDLNFAINDNLSAVVMKALNKPPQKRYQDGRKLAAALAEALEEDPDAAVLGLAAPAGGADAATLITGGDTATVVSGIRPDGSAADSGPSLFRRTVSRRAFIIPAVAGLAVVTGVLLMISGSKSSSNPGAAPPGPNEPAFSRAVISVWLAKSHEAYEKAVNNKDEISAETCEAADSEAKIRVVDDATGDELSHTSASDNIAKFKHSSSAITVTVTRDGYKQHVESAVARKPGDVFQKDIVLDRM